MQADPTQAGPPLMLSQGKNRGLIPHCLSLHQEWSPHLDASPEEAECKEAP